MEEKGVKLAVVKGPDKGKQWTLSASDYHTIGRSHENSITLSDPTVSKQHAMVECVDEIWFVRDLGSTHGTYVGEEEVTERHTLFHKDVIRIGKTYIAVGLPK
ncbi:MAG: FHA domain-containing protein [Planctomycetota bacterium]